jgi:hypothetical protein
MFPCHKGAAFLQTQRAGSQGELVDVDCSGCCHAKISTIARRGVGETHTEETKILPKCYREEMRTGKANKRGFYVC